MFPCVWKDGTLEVIRIILFELVFSIGRGGDWWHGYVGGEVQFGMGGVWDNLDGVGNKVGSDLVLNCLTGYTKLLTCVL